VDVLEQKDNSIIIPDLTSSASTGKNLDAVTGADPALAGSNTHVSPMSNLISTVQPTAAPANNLISTVQPTTASANNSISTAQPSVSPMSNLISTAQPTTASANNLISTVQPTTAPANNSISTVKPTTALASIPLTKTYTASMVHGTPDKVDVDGIIVTVTKQNDIWNVSFI
jgi:hypothetical protein